MYQFKVGDRLRYKCGTIFCPSCRSKGILGTVTMVSESHVWIESGSEVGGAILLPLDERPDGVGWSFDYEDNSIYD